MILPKIYGNIKKNGPKNVPNHQLRSNDQDVLIHWTWGSPWGSPFSFRPAQQQIRQQGTAGHSWAQLGSSSWRLCHRSTMMRFKRASWASRRSSRLWAWAETRPEHPRPGGTRHGKYIGKSMGKIGGNQIYWDIGM